MLLTRDQFREGVFARDKHQCVICGKVGQDAHHIIERRLWTDGGYYLNNGATLCGTCHLEAEETTLSCEDIRRCAGITKTIVPAHMYPDEQYDKWGNTILPNGSRMRGELFNDESVQKVLVPVLRRFTKYVKYPRTFHLPNSPGRTNDDRVLGSVDNFIDTEIVVTVKMDGENTTIYNDYVHARSIDGMDAEDKHWVKNLQSQIGYNIPDGWRVCGENLWAKHSIYYQNLPSYFLMFSIWDDNNVCLDWDTTKEWAELLGLNMVPELFRGKFYPELAKGEQTVYNGGFEQEGLVVRKTKAFHYREFSSSVAKYVRAGHVQTSHNWRREVKIRNSLV